MIHYHKRLFMNIKAKCFLFFVLFLFNNFIIEVHALGISRNNIEIFTVNDGLVGNETHSVFKDSDGFIWIATRYGINFYDGYMCRTFKSDFRVPNLLTSNDVKCVAEDKNNQIWFGTTNGINVLNKSTGNFWHHDIKDVYNKCVSCLLVSRNGTVWIGTESGLVSYDATKKIFTLYKGDLAGDLSGKPIKTLLEDKRGDIWIGTWDRGLFRYSSSQKKFFHYPKMNSRNSAHVLYEDKRGNIWVASWDGGLALLQNPYDMENFSWKEFKHDPEDPKSLVDNLVYSIGTDATTGDMWVGSRTGLSVMDVDKIWEGFTNYIADGNIASPLPYGEICSIENDEMGNVWLATVKNGIMMVRRTNNLFENYSPKFDSGNTITSSVNALYVDEWNNIWCGLTSQGFTYMTRNDNTFHRFSEIPEFKEIQFMASVNCFMKRKAGNELWIGTYGDGLFIYEKGEPVKCFNTWNSSFIKDNSIMTLFEDQNGNVWFGCKAGLSVLLANGKSYIYNNFKIDGHDYTISTVNSICQDKEGRIWLSTYEDGLVCLSGDLIHPDKLEKKAYAQWNGKLPTSSIFSLFYDSKNRLWVGTINCGLLRYDSSTDSFVEAGIYSHFLSDRIMSINEDDLGNLWLSTGSGLACFNPDNPKADVKLFSSANGLINMEYMPNSSFFLNGYMYFGGNSGFSVFMPSSLMNKKKESSLFFTDFRFGGKSIYDMLPDERSLFIDKLPFKSEKITVPSDCNVLTIEFSSLMYSSPRQARYAYILEGVDKDWQYTTIGHNSVSYSNLPSGTYKFRLRAANENGVWSGEGKTLMVSVLAPWYNTWIARILYILIFLVIALYFVFTLRRQYKLKRSLYYKTLERESADKLSHAKMQFFTNITHELLTPLTIISASIDELKAQYPNGTELYEAMTYNVNRLLRLLQQILDFRKAETGNLRLKVRYGEIMSFISKCTEEFIPLMKRNKLDFKVNVNPEILYGYFDSDKVEKILYNLISNAAKYNKEGGYVYLDINRLDNMFITITVRDNGRGMSKKEQKHVFRRFYDGEHPNNDVKGNGIGLSLTYDIVKLYSGEITFVSEEGKGTEFKVKLPISRDCFLENDIVDDDSLKRISDIKDVDIDTKEESINETDDNVPTILIVEDNEELLTLMKRLLSKEYNVLVATNGKEGIDMVKSNYVNMIISDVMMPEMNGMVFCKYIKDSIDYCHIPVILLTALTKDEDKVQAYESGADAYITKPFDMMVLRSRIKNLLRVVERNARNFQKSFSVDEQEGMMSIDETLMQKIIECIKKHLDDPEFDQQQLFEEVGVSKSTLYRKLKTLTGLSPSSLIRKYRLETARKIIEKNKHIRVSELAYSVGFNDPKYFSTIFKKEYGKLPSEIQNE